MKKITVSICIPAYNEEENIENILKQIFKQKKDGFIIKEIFVSSDGSTDRTVEIAKKYEKKGVRIHEGQVNRGQTYRQNEIIAKSTTDILVLLNADIVLGDDKVIYRLILPIVEGADLTAQWAKPLHPQTFFERILYAGFHLKYYVYSNYKGGNNIYTCIGHMRALSKRFYSTVIFPTVSDGEDQFLYLSCVSGGYKYRHPNKISSYFRLPNSFNDYKDYAIRIFQTQTKFQNVFEEKLIKKERYLPISLQIKGCLHIFKHHPLHGILYIIMHLVVQQWALRKPYNSKNTFRISTSTKKLNISNFQHTISKEVK
jgi:glycosyltransferase involved in cell wall biosynthesis